MHANKSWDRNLAMQDFLNVLTENHSENIIASLEVSNVLLAFSKLFRGLVLRFRL